MAIQNIFEARRRIDEMPTNPKVLKVIPAKTEIIEAQIILKTAYLGCARIGEIISRKTAGDKTAHPTGAELRVSETVYIPNLYNPVEHQALFMTKMLTEGKQPQIQDLMKIREPVLLLSIVTEKRALQKEAGEIVGHMWKRECAVPMNPNYEPWAKQVYDYISEKQKELTEGKGVFPIDRKVMWKIARATFDGLTYTIQPYLRAEKDKEGNYLRSETETDKFGRPKLLTKPIPEKEKDAANHALRHWRKEELEMQGFTAKECDSYGGWTQTEGANLAGQRYSRVPWNQYFPKLLARRIA